VPAAGQAAAAGEPVTLFVSGGFPELAFDNDRDILRVNGANGRRLDPIADGPSREKDPAFSPDGTRVAYVGGGRVFLANLERPNASPVELTTGTDEFSDLAWAPTADLNLLAMSRLKGQDRDLCLGRITRDGMTPACKPEPRFSVGQAIHWAPDGRSILGFGVFNDDLSRFGIVQWRSKKPFSPNLRDWSAGRFKTDTSIPTQGVKDAALSPDGKQLAVVVKQGDSPFRLMLTKRGDFSLANARRTGVRACRVAWRPDGVDLVVVQADRFCQESVGTLARLPVRDPRQLRQLDASGDNPVFQPLTLGG